MENLRESEQNPAPTKTEQKTKAPAITPGQMRVIKRNGSVVTYDQEKIAIAITKAFLAVEGGAAAASTRIHNKVNELANVVTMTFSRRMPSGGTLHIEEIQDQVELALMRSEERTVARSYVLYREERTKARKERTGEEEGEKKQEKTGIKVVLDDGTESNLDEQRLYTMVAEACEGLQDVSIDEIIEEAKKNLYDGVSMSDVRPSLVMTARTLVEKEPNYTFVTARILLDNLRTEALTFLDVRKEATQAEMENLYPEALETFIKKGIENEILDPELQTFDIKRLGEALKPERDKNFTYLGLQTLYDRYFIHKNNIRYELPQVFFMRVAMGLSLNEEKREKRAIEFYNLLSKFDYMSSTPTLFNSGTIHSQLSSCYLTTVPDDLYGIYGAMQDNAMLSKWAGGLGNDWTPVRGLGSHIKGTNGKSQGVVPFLKVVNDTAVAVNQGGKRKGAVCSYLETWHIDIEEFLELRKNTGDDRRRTHDMNTANWVPDLFMKRVSEGKPWTLFTPSDTPDLHDLYGKAFEERYQYYEGLTQTGEMDFYKKVDAAELWKKMLSMLFETGHPWITFKDACNLRSPQQHIGVIHSSNLCTEITLNTSQDEIAVCNLGSVNLTHHLKEGKLDLEKLEQTINTAIRMLDNVININYYAVQAAENSNKKHRPIGLGIMGFHDTLYMLKMPYSSDEAIEFADRSMETVSYFAIKASSNLAKERGSYSSYEGSLWSKGILPIDSVSHLREDRGEEYTAIDRSTTLDWDSLRELVLEQGMRNSNVMAIAPTATIANITGVSQSIEPTYQNLYVKSNLSGEFTVTNLHLVNALKELGLWDSVMINDLKYYDGSLKEIPRVPDDIKTIYATAFEVEPRWLIEAASRRQKWIDQSQSLNLYIDEPNGKKLDIMYRMAWLKGLKTTYYLRSRGATTIEKSTIATGELNAVTASQEPEAEDMPEAGFTSDPDCEACQ
ncbi:MAG: ribonucleoside-diphosphate reductase subunit alpha [SAR86 cluster bacterium]|jgi:ribonucleoside-diphosphate reductase alpha chain|nr:ribonucleoside-diphosphate reductase subunit alpha [SAR86 cluster bacterium]